MGITKKNKRLHFGVLFSTMDNTCLHEIWNGIVEYAEIHDIHLTAYMATYQTTDEDFASHVETCFETLWSSNSLDGVIIFAGFLAQHLELSNHVEQGSFDEYIARIPSNIPVVSVSFAIPGIPSVMADNVGGIYGAVDHLIQSHGKKQIAFVKGPDGHPEAEERLEGYKKALEANGIPFDAKYVLPGQFSQESGVAAVAELIDVRKLSADSIVASDDETAIGVLNELKKRNISVPSDMAVTGFDDDRLSATFIPSISTARQDFSKIGLISAETLSKRINNEPTDDIIYVPSVFVSRQSCGCLKKDFLSDNQKDESAEVDSFTLFVLQKLMLLFQHDVPQQRIQDWGIALTEKIKETPFRKEEFLTLFDEILAKYNHYSKEISMWYDALNILTLGVESYSNEIKDANSIMAAFIYATTLVHNIHIKEEKIKEIASDDTRLLLRRVASALVLIFDIDSLAEELYKLLPELSMNTALVGLYHEPIKSNEPNTNRTIDTLIGFDGKKKFNMKHNSWNPILFSDYSTIDSFDFESKRRNFFFIPLFFRDEEVGVILLPYDANIPIDAYETLRINISTAVKGAELLSKIQTLSVTDELTGLLNRRGFHQFVYSRLQHLSRNKDMIPTIMFMDMDGLKTINDTYGHNAGDIAIAAFANILKDALREEDIIGRVGGDEFVVFSSVKSEKNSMQVEKRIREKLDEYNSQNLHPYKVMGSIGSVVLDSSTKECFESAMLSADSVLYEEKMEKKKKGLSRR
jgi:diguanylate cyclase (GGDEF)-like protein